jgi:[Skp1-protein]-hydroxyproline N-acetylglucosaminyltransferase
MRSPKSGNRRKGSFVLTADRPLAFALVALFILYTVVTLATYFKVSLTDDTPVRYSLDSTSSATMTTISTTSAAVSSRETIAVGGISAILALQNTFPIHVGDDTIEIQHPGYASLNPEAQARKWPADLPKTMVVPKFFSDSHAKPYSEYNGSNSIRDFLGHNGLRLITPEQASHIGSTITSTTGEALETIYCSVASYRDPECTASVANVFSRAAHPERIRVAILDQRTSGDDICGVPDHACDTQNADAPHNDDHAIFCKYRHLIDRYEMDARWAVGPVFARHLAHRYYRGEYFAMQIDSHVRFTADWDTDIVEQWKSAHNEMAVLTTYLSDIIGSIDPLTNANTHPGRPIMCQSDYEGNGKYRHLRHGQQPEGIPGIHGQPTLEPFWAAGFSFARGHFVIQVPYDQFLPMVFQGEEISIGLRGFTHGYDYYAPERSVCFHMYAIKENTAKRKNVPLFWENGSLYTGVGQLAMNRLNSIIGMENFPEDEWITTDRDMYGLGQVRTANTFFETFGIHPERHSVELHLCRFVGKPMMAAFLPARRANGMGLDYDKISYKFVDPDTKTEGANIKQQA